MNFKTIISLPFDYDVGVLHLNDLEELCAPHEIINATKTTIVQEINGKIGDFRINKWMMCLIPLGMIVFMAGGVSSMAIFPYSLAIVFFGMFLFMSFPCYACYKKSQQLKMISNLAMLIDQRTKGIIRMESHYDTRVNVNYNNNFNNEYGHGYSRTNVSTERVLTRLDFRIIQSRLNLYQSLNPGNGGMQGQFFAPDMGQPHMNMGQPHMNMGQPNMNMGQPHMNMGQPHMNMGQPQMNNMHQPFIPNEGHHYQQPNTFNVQNMNQHYPS
jgi:hypothetical protein